MNKIIHILIEIQTFERGRAGQRALIVEVQLAKFHVVEELVESQVVGF
jgi:hypothetical protein